jgi:GGDEF domain-containing protein
VMGVAVHWGRKAGTLAALVACLLYLAVRLPLLAAGLSPQAFVLMVSRFAGYCLIGLVGGEIFGRVKYIFAGSRESGVIDDWSRVYNQRYALRAIEQATARYRRYQEPFSLVVLRLEPVLTATRRPEKLRGLVRTVAGFLRDDVRLVDDVARLDDGRFVVLLPHTAAKAAPVVAARLVAGVCGTLGVKGECVTSMSLGADEHTPALEAFAASIAYPDERPDSSAGVRRIEVGFNQHSEA